MTFTAILITINIYILGCIVSNIVVRKCIQFKLIKTGKGPHEIDPSNFLTTMTLYSWLGIFGLLCRFLLEAILAVIIYLDKFNERSLK